MSNESILRRMIEACDRFDAGKIDTDQVGEEVRALASNLELIQKPAKAVAERFWIDLFSGSEFIRLGSPEVGWKEIDDAVSVLREWVTTELARMGVESPTSNQDAPPESN